MRISAPSVGRPAGACRFRITALSRCSRLLLPVTDGAGIIVTFHAVIGVTICRWAPTGRTMPQGPPRSDAKGGDRGISGHRSLAEPRAKEEMGADPVMASGLRQKPVQARRRGKSIFACLPVARGRGLEDARKALHAQDRCRNICTGIFSARGVVHNHPGRILHRGIRVRSIRGPGGLMPSIAGVQEWPGACMVAESADPGPGLRPAGEDPPTVIDTKTPHGHH
jgi:hypothetical protein